MPRQHASWSAARPRAASGALRPAPRRRALPLRIVHRCERVNLGPHRPPFPRHTRRPARARQSRLARRTPASIWTRRGWPSRSAKRPVIVLALLVDVTPHVPPSPILHAELVSASIAPPNGLCEREMDPKQVQGTGRDDRSHGCNRGLSPRLPPAGASRTPRKLNTDRRRAGQPHERGVIFAALSNRIRAEPEANIRSRSPTQTAHTSIPRCSGVGLDRGLTTVALIPSPPAHQPLDSRGQPTARCAPPKVSIARRRPPRSPCLRAQTSVTTRGGVPLVV